MGNLIHYKRKKILRMQMKLKEDSPQDIFSY